MYIFLCLETFNKHTAPCISSLYSYEPDQSVCLKSLRLSSACLTFSHLFRHLAVVLILLFYNLKMGEMKVNEQTKTIRYIDQA